jgi:hypothetical protein
MRDLQASSRDGLLLWRVGQETDLLRPRLMRRIHPNHRLIERHLILGVDEHHALGRRAGDQLRRERIAQVLGRAHLLRVEVDAVALDRDDELILLVRRRRPCTSTFGGTSSMSSPICSRFPTSARFAQPSSSRRSAHRHDSERCAVLVLCWRGGERAYVVRLCVRRGERRADRRRTHSAWTYTTVPATTPANAPRDCG